MRGICVITKDERLKRQIVLLLSAHDYTVIKSGTPILYIVDRDTTGAFRVSESARTLTVSREGGAF